jgi:1D-myo-inositol-triphosphate 3-kinase
VIFLIANLSMFQVVGSSLLLVREGSKVGAWVIDFAKARSSDTPLDHRSPWVVGNHEDGFLFGLDVLIEVNRNLSTDVSIKIVCTFVLQPAMP